MEIGPGYSTCVILKALKQNFDETGILPKLYCLEQDQFYLIFQKVSREKPRQRYNKFYQNLFLQT